MKEIHQTPGGTIRIANEGQSYKDSLDNFLSDLQGDIAYPALPEGMQERYYNPDTRHSVHGSGNQCGTEEGFPWPDGDRIIAMCGVLLTRQAAR